MSYLFQSINPFFNDFARYPNPYYKTRVNYFSSSDPSVTYDGAQTGDAESDNARVLREKRYVMAALNNEFQNCPALGNFFLKPYSIPIYRTSNF